MHRNDSNTTKAIRTVYLSIAGNLLLAIVKGVTGIVGNSYALVADAIESTTDVFSSILVLFGIKYAAKPADENHPYGHGKAEALITFAVVGFLIVSATIIATESINNIRTPHSAPEWYTLIVLALIVIFKEVSYRIVNKRGKEVNSTSIQADAWHHRSDAITSLMALIGISIALVMGEGYETADDWAAFFASGFILFNAYLIFRPALGEIMDEHLHDHLIEIVREQTMEVDGVISTEKCFIRKTGMWYFIDLHVKVNGSLSVTKGHEIAHAVKDHLKSNNPEIRDILIHIEPA